MARTRTIPVEHLFWSIVQPTLEDDRCWEWPKGRGTFGYGLFVLYDTEGQKQEEKAHRVAWTFAFGYIPEGLHVLHACDNPPCCRPSHLFLGIQKDNVDDMVRKGRNVAPTKGEAWGRTNHGHILFLACMRCGTTTIKHKSKGLCLHCYGHDQHQIHKTANNQKSHDAYWLHRDERLRKQNEYDKRKRSQHID